MKYNWQQNDWLDFRYDPAQIQDILIAFAEKTGHVGGVLKSLPDEIQTETIVDLMVSEAIKTSEIEGEYLSRSDVMSSIKHNLGLQTDNSKITDMRAKGVADLMVDVRSSFKEALSKEKLFEWHKMLMSGQGGSMVVGNWRTHQEPMQVISGPIGKLKIHFEAPPSSRVPEEMEHFISWFNETSPTGKRSIKNPVIRSATAHLYFESIHPFEDGNGRIGRAISEKALSQGLNRPVLLSLSDTIEENKKAYYDALKTAQKSNEITDWLIYFADLALAAQTRTERYIEFILKKSKFYDRYSDLLNERQTKVIRRMFDSGIQGFEGGMTTKKYIAITKTSKATATRDLQHLSETGALNQIGGGRSTRYKLNLDSAD